MNCPRCQAEMPEDFAFCGRCGYALGEDFVPYDAAAGDDPSDTGELKWADVRSLGAGKGDGPRSGAWKREPLAAAKDMTLDLGKFKPGWDNDLDDSNGRDDGFDDSDSASRFGEVDFEGDGDADEGLDESPDAAEEIDEAGFEDDARYAPRNAPLDVITISAAPAPGAMDASGDDPFVLSPHGVTEPEVVSADAIAYLKKHRKGGRLIYVVIVAVLVVAAIVGFSIWNNAYRPYDIDEATFPDPSVRAAAAKADTDGDGKLSRKEAAAATSLEIEGAASVSGIGMFSNLESLTATGEELESIDLSGLASLKSLDVSGSGVEEIDLSACPALESLDAHDSRLASLDTAPVGSLVSLDVSGTKVETLDVASNQALSSLSCDDRVAVAGIEATGLAEYWIVTSYTATSDDSGKVNTTRISASYDEDNRITDISYMDSSDTGNARYSYDEAGRLIGMSYGLGTDEHANWTLAYNEAGHLVKAVDGVTGATYEYAFDGAGRVVSYSAANADAYGNGSTRQASYSYDDAGRLVRIEGDGAASLTYGEAGHLTAFVTDDGSYACHFAYDPSGRCTAGTRPGRYSDVEESFFYDEAGRLAGAARSAGYSSDYKDVESSAFSCDSNGNITSASIIGTDGAADTCTVSYKRVFATPDKAPVGITPLLGDPLQYCLASDWAWQPWAIEAPSDENDSAFVTVFNRTQALLQSSLGLRVIPMSAEEKAAAAQAQAPAAGEQADPAPAPAEEQAAQPQEDHQYGESQSYSQDYGSDAYYEESYDYSGYSNEGGRQGQ